MGGSKIKNGSRNVTTPLSGTVCPEFTGNSYSLCTEFEISTFTHYKDIEGEEKCKNLGGLAY